MIRSLHKILIRLIGTNSIVEAHCRRRRRRRVEMHSLLAIDVEVVRLAASC